jgi:UDP-N-acetylmuramate: L-alanyl-gamma-D-glutamyl-meso-diaminopimelate ligase
LGILTSAEFDHADIYPDFDAVLAAFRQFTALIPPGGLLAAWGDSPVVRELAAGGRGEVIHYGLGPENHWRAVDLAPSGRRTRFQLLRPGRPPVTLQAPLPGRHNVLNTLAAAVILDRVGVPPEALASSLDRFQGVRRRQEVRGIKSGVTVIDDFAHHPTAVRETTAAVRTAYPDARLVAVFEPRSNTSLRSVFQDEYAEAFGGADLVLLRRPTHLFKAPENQRMDVDRLAADLVGKGLDARLLDDTDGLLDELTAEVRAGDVVLIMSNGGFDDIHRRLLDRL